MVCSKYLICCPFLEEKTFILIITTFIWFTCYNVMKWVHLNKNKINNHIHLMAVFTRSVFTGNFSPIFAFSNNAFPVTTPWLVFISEMFLFRMLSVFLLCHISPLFSCYQSLRFSESRDHCKRCFRKYCSLLYEALAHMHWLSIYFEE